MRGELSGIAKQLINIFQESKKKKKVALIYAFNGTGKTRLSLDFKKQIVSESDDNDQNDIEDQPIKYLYYNAFTEDLFYWDNDLENGVERKLKIRSNKYTQWVLEEQGYEDDVMKCFQQYTNTKLSPKFNDDYSEVVFSFQGGNDDPIEYVKISKGEESCFIWSIFYTLLSQILRMDVTEEGSDTDKYNELEYIFIDDPVTSLDEGHLIKLAVDLAELIKNAKRSLKFIITTHNTLFYNILFNELTKSGYFLSRSDDGTYQLEKKSGSSNTTFSYHLHLIELLREAIKSDTIQKYHFMFLRNLYEKTASFLGYKNWGDLLDSAKGDPKAYYTRVINFSSHKSLSSEEVASPNPQEKKMLEFLLNNLLNNYGFKQAEKEEKIEKRGK